MNYMLSLIVGLGVGALYGLLQVRSPAPPVIALIGLLGMVAGEQAVSAVRSHLHAPAAATSSAANAPPASPPMKDVHHAP
ncbi:DUF1427 family protein [Xylophilus sp. GW821-FHT01B05]